MPRHDRSPRQRMSPAQRRAALLAAAQAAFARAPYDAVAVASVAASAGASEALVHRYFGSKAGLYTEVVRSGVDTLRRALAEAEADLPAGTAPRDRLARSVEVYLDFVSSRAVGWAAALRGYDAAVPEVAHLRVAVRRHLLAELRRGLALPPGAPTDHALAGYLGFVDAACGGWVDAGCPPGERGVLVAMCVGALEGALGALPSTCRLTPGA